MNDLKPSEDGITHINIYTRGKTPLGRKATNLADIPTYHPTLGSFRTVEGLYYFCKTGKTDDQYRVISGFDAKKLGQSQPMVWNKDFQKEVRVAIIYKVMHSEEILSLLKQADPTIPFTHYYYYGTSDNPVVRQPKGHEWQVELWEAMRSVVQRGESLRTLLD